MKFSVASLAVKLTLANVIISQFSPECLEDLIKHKIVYTDRLNIKTIQSSFLLGCLLCNSQQIHFIV